MLQYGWNSRTISELSQSQKDKYYITPLTWVTWSNQIHRDGKWTGGYQWQEGGGNGELLIGIEFQFCKMTSVVETGCTTMWIYLTLLNCMLKMARMVNFMSRIFYCIFSQVCFLLSLLVPFSPTTSQREDFVLNSSEAISTLIAISS